MIHAEARRRVARLNQVFLFVIFSAAACSTGPLAAVDPRVDACSNHCSNGIADCGEKAVDCSGECTPCVDPCAGHCADGKLDCGETGTDCGGDECTACSDPCSGHCENGKRDCGETGTDCGGTCNACTAAALPILRGVSLAGAEFGEDALPGTYGTNYIYPTREEVDHFIDLRMNLFRLPFLWERLQHQQRAALDSTELGRIDAFVSYATVKGAYVLLDPHNYARYFGGVIGSDVPAAAFADFWSKLAVRYRDNARVIFGLMNEPHTMSTEVWLASANAAIAAIRATGATNTIFVPGNAWTGAGSWLQDWYGTPNAEVMLGIDDPLDNYIIEVHQYLDEDSSGTNMGSCPAASAGPDRVSALTDWLAAHGLRAFLGEFGAGDSSACLTAVDNLLDYLDARPELWIGWAYWAAGPWWGSSLGNIEPTAAGDRAQTLVLETHVR